MKLQDEKDEVNFKRGPRYIVTAEGIRRETPWDRIKESVVAFVDAYIRRSRHMQICGVDQVTGTITIKLVRWSWRRLRWEDAP